MRILVIDEAAKAATKKVQEYALLHRHSIHDIMRRLKSGRGIDDLNYTTELVDGWRVTYSIEQHQSGWYHHISVSVDPRDNKKMFPHEVGVSEILNLFGLGPAGTHTHGWTEDAGQRKAINLLFPFTELKTETEPVLP